MRFLRIASISSGANCFCSKCSISSTCRGCPNARRYIARVFRIVSSLPLVPTERVHGDYALDLDPVGINMPVRNQFAFTAFSLFLIGDLKECIQHPRLPRSVPSKSIYGRFLPDHQPFIPIYPALPLFKINRIARQVPMHDLSAILVKVEAFLPMEVVAKTKGLNGELKFSLIVVARCWPCSVSSFWLPKSTA